MLSPTFLPDRRNTFRTNSAWADDRMPAVPSVRHHKPGGGAPRQACTTDHTGSRLAGGPPSGWVGAAPQDKCSWDVLCVPEGLSSGWGAGGIVVDLVLRTVRGLGEARG